MHLVISTRADPDLPLARWRSGASWSRSEPPICASRRTRPTRTSTWPPAWISPTADIAVLEERTEGWIAALQLAALSIQGRDDVSGFIARFAGDDRYIVDYLVEEVLRHQPDPVRRFLLQSAVLDRLTGPLCDAVTGRDDGGEMLLPLERANLFIVALDDRREWYRYHHLFADVLRARMLSEQPDQVPLLHQRASQWYERHDLAEEAIRHALAARDFDRAAHLIELAMPAIRRHRQDAMLFGWLKALPDDDRPAQPGAQRLLRIPADDLRRSRGGRDPTRRRGTRAGRRTRRGSSALAGHRRAPDVAGDHRHLPRLARPGPG